MSFMDGPWVQTVGITERECQNKVDWILKGLLYSLSIIKYQNTHTTVKDLHCGFPSAYKCIVFFSSSKSFMIVHI